MSGNSFGKLFTVTSFGESHGPSIGCIVDGCPPGMELTEADLQGDLDRRRPGKTRFVTQRKELDQVKILSGVFEGKTTGTPIGMMIENTDQRSKDYGNIMHQFRPAHADYTYHQKYGFRDYRGGGRSSARETAMRVAAGGIAKKYLREQFGIEITGYLAQLGSIVIEKLDWEQLEKSAFFCPDADKEQQLEQYMKALKEFPLLNASLDGDRILIKKEYHIGVAVAVEKGLVVPNIFNAEEKNLTGLARSVNDLAARARTRKLLPDEMANGTFSISNFGVYGTTIGFPIINQPQVAILGVGAIKKRPVVINDAIAIRPIMYLALTIDHRLIDGAMGSQFLERIRELLEAYDPKAHI